MPREGRRIAVAILEVLAGLHKPQQAAQVLGISLVRYYQIETQALKALVLACEPSGPGPRSDGGQRRELARLQRENRSLQQQVARALALVRLAHRSAGLGGSPGSQPVVKLKGKPGRGKGLRKPQVRALRLARRLKGNAEGADGQESLPDAASGPGKPAATPPPLCDTAH